MARGNKENQRAKGKGKARASPPPETSNMPSGPHTPLTGPPSSEFTFRAPLHAPTPPTQSGAPIPEFNFGMLPEHAMPTPQRFYGVSANYGTPTPYAAHYFPPQAEPTAHLRGAEASNQGMPPLVHTSTTPRTEAPNVPGPRMMTPEQYAAIEARCRELEAREAARIAAQNNAAAGTSRSNPSKPVPKPKGEAGDGKRGFVLQEAMGLMDDPHLYNEILRSVRSNADKAGIDMEKTYRKQDAETLGKVFKAGRLQFPYLGNNRFAHDWPQAEMLKQYLKNRRRYAARQARERQAMLKKKLPSCLRENVEGSNGEPMAGPSRPTKRQRISAATSDDDEEDDEDDDNVHDDDD